MRLMWEYSWGKRVRERAFQGRTPAMAYAIITYAVVVAVDRGKAIEDIHSYS